MRPGTDAPAEGLYGPSALLGLLNAVLAEAGSDEAEVWALAECERYSRFAHERLHQTLDRENLTISVRVIHDGRLGHVQCGADVAPREMILLAREAACGAELPGAFHFAGAEDGGTEIHDAKPPYFHPGTAAFSPDAKARAIAEAVGLAEQRQARIYGAAHTTLYELAVATSRGRRAYVPLTEAGWNLVSTWRNLSGMGYGLGRDSAALDAAAIVQESLDRAAPGDLLGGAPGETGKVRERRLPVVLAGYALADALSFLSGLGFQGMAVLSGTGPLRTGGGEICGSPLVHVRDEGLSPLGLPIPFDEEGMPKSPVELITAGRPISAVYDLHAAALAGRRSTGHAHVSRIAFAEPVACNVQMAPGALSDEQLIAGVERGVYITSFHYTRLVDPAEGVITGMTRHGTFLIEGGRITRPLGNVRFTESVFAMLRGVEAVGRTLQPQPMLNVFNSCVLAPSVRIREFQFDLVDA